jgi:hypothetical protein
VKRGTEILEALNPHGQVLSGILKPSGFNHLFLMESPPLWEFGRANKYKPAGGRVYGSQIN